MCAWWCWTPSAGRSSSSAYLVDRYSGCRSCATTSRVDVEQPAEVLDALGERAQRLGVLQVPDVVRDEGVAPPGQAERVLQLGAAGQHGAREPGGDGEGLGHVAAGAAEQHRAAAEAPGHRVVGPDVDGPVVGQERVGDALQRVPGLVVAVDDRLVGDVSAGQDDRTGHGGEQQVVQRRVRQHDAELAVARGGGVRDGGAGPAGQQHDRAGRAGQQGGGRVVDLGQFRGRGQVGGHHRERLVLAVLALAERGDGLLAGGVGGQVVAAQALDGEDAAAAEEFGGRLERVLVASVQRPSRGPQAGQQVGWAWKRRSAGSWYSAAHRSHIANGAIVVSGRSYGTSRTMVNRGPQLVQLMNGYPWRRSAGSASSRRQSAQVAVSAETRVRRSPVRLRWPR